MKKSVVLLSSLVVSAVFSVAQAQETVRIGAITTLTGRLAEFGAQQKAGFELAVDELNAKGGIGGKKIELVLEDAASDVNKALAAAEKLANSGVGIILNEYSSSIVKPVAQFLSRQKVPNIVVSSSDESITKPGFDYVYRINPPTDEYAKILFEVFKDKKIRSVAILAGSGAFEKSVLNSAMEQSKTLNIPVVASQTYDKGLTDFRPILNGFKAKNPDAVMLVGYQEDSVAVMRQAKEVGLNPKVFAGGAAGFALPDFIKGAGSASEYVVTATAWVPEMGSKQKALYDKLSRKLGMAPTYHAAQAYAAVLVAADAIKRAGSSTDREAIRKALDSTNLQTAYAPVKFQNYEGYKNQNKVGMVAEQVQNVGGQLVFVSVYPRKLFLKNRMLFPTPAWDKRN
ncbi:ABC transporter substrate-binding protein [Deinococcus cellulosilyticus]|uniref:Branched-chain amino acid ABC transporter substrate-binding protein n=1 Tax=Deinococcus cellulosilyticus (strain DSM 18568 / NBRC 106333 / KACC 11606 / 5516J-15) TaxID=1223518 RepID=A0A511N1W0_DEIC1|nr:ABC transporter substrate-binding protein [Deinococcus cellulosilyticus]GEM46845.1 branched-chain amino acid ABC transporter substrate-binding protein [Deinococcus cellulosilyticus NBRC 106333 = KACC 11606]